MLNKNYWQNKNVFVTGATGLLGSWLVKRLTDEKANVTILLRDWVTKSNIALSDLLKQVNVVHGGLKNIPGAPNIGVES